MRFRRKTRLHLIAGNSSFFLPYFFWTACSTKKNRIGREFPLWYDALIRFLYNREFFFKANRELKNEVFQIGIACRRSGYIEWLR